MAAITHINNNSFYDSAWLYKNDSAENNETVSEDTVTGEAVQDEEKNTPESSETELTREEKKEVDSLKKRDKEVRAHEMAHITAGGQYITKRATFEYETGPDGKRYAVGGEVGIDVSEVKDDPEATISKMQTVQRAALAPAEPSSADRSVASEAARKEEEARSELIAINSETGSPSSAAEAYESTEENPETEKGSRIDMSV